MTPEEKLTAYKMLIDGAVWIDLNMSDTFAFATTEGERMDATDVEKMLPLILKYGHKALIAYAAVVRKAEPIQCKCNHADESYHAAKREIEEMRKVDEYFMFESQCDEKEGA